MAERTNAEERRELYCGNESCLAPKRDGANYCYRCGDELEKSSAGSGIAKVVASDVASFVSRKGRDLGSFLAREVGERVADLGLYASYPVLGNLPGKTQWKIWRKNSKYDPCMGTAVSALANVTASTVGGYVSQRYGCDTLSNVLALYALFSIPEGFFRWAFEGIEREPIASVLGKAVSIPIEAGFYVGRKIKKYARDVKMRSTGKVRIANEQEEFITEEPESLGEQKEFDPLDNEPDCLPRI